MSRHIQPAPQHVFGQTRENFHRPIYFPSFTLVRGERLFPAAG